MTEPLPVVRVAQGALLGREAQRCGGGRYYSFQGVPYARPPVGPLRFKPPQPPASWKGVRDATKEGSVAPQLNPFTGNFVGDEDCLFLNVYTPQLPGGRDRSLLSVMVWIHGGGFTTGSGNTDVFGPDYLLEHDVVVVTLNYRLGVLGFLSTRDSVLPGNLGLKDQVAALRWVRDNIDVFGGDPGRVTIFGESAGSVCCHLHLFSPMTRGLFHGVIMQSGAMTPLSLDIPLRERSFRLAAHLGLPADSSKQLLDSLVGLPAETLVENILEARSTEERLRLDVYPFRPTIEPADAEGGAYITEDIESVLAKGECHRVPVIMGVNSLEGMFQIKDVIVNKEAMDGFNENLEIVVPTNVKIPKENRSTVAKRIREYYFKDKELSEDMMLQFAEMKGDVWFVYPTLRAARTLSRLSNPSSVFLYLFDVDGRLNMYKTILRFQKYPGACHADDLLYLFKPKKWFVEVEPDSMEAKAVAQMTRLWTNFAKTGNPTGGPKDNLLPLTWTHYSEDNPCYLHISNSGLAVKQNLFKERMDFWNNIYN